MAKKEGSHMTRGDRLRLATHTCVAGGCLALLGIAFGASSLRSVGVGLFVASLVISLILFILSRRVRN